jgi:hypothetical protein
MKKAWFFLIIFLICCIVNLLQHEADCPGNKIKTPVKNYLLTSGVMNIPDPKNIHAP